MIDGAGLVVPVSLMWWLTGIGLLGGLLVFSVAPYWPSVFPPAFARFVGFGSVAAALAPLWALTESWRLPAIAGAAALLVMAAVTLYQVKHPVQPATAVASDEPAPEPETADIGA